jgi:hypothetical protein
MASSFGRYSLIIGVQISQRITPVKKKKTEKQKNYKNFPKAIAMPGQERK